MRKKELQAMTGDRRPAPHTQCKWARASTLQLPRVSASQMRDTAIHSQGDWQEPPKKTITKRRRGPGFGSRSECTFQKRNPLHTLALVGGFLHFRPNPSIPQRRFPPSLGPSRIAEPYFISIIPSRSLNSIEARDMGRRCFGFKSRYCIGVPCSRSCQQVPKPSNDWPVTHGSCPCRISPSPPAAAFEPSHVSIENHSQALTVSVSTLSGLAFLVAHIDHCMQTPILGKHLRGHADIRMTQQSLRSG